MEMRWQYSWKQGQGGGPIVGIQGTQDRYVEFKQCRGGSWALRAGTMAVVSAKLVTIPIVLRI